MVLLIQHAHPFSLASCYKLKFPLSNHNNHLSFCASTSFSKGPILRSKLGRRRRHWNKPFTCYSSLASASLPPDPDKEQRKDEDQDLQTLLRRFWKVAAPYWSSDDKVQARLQLAGVFALTLATTGISVGFNFLGRDFYNALANKDQEQFTRQLLYYLGGFATGIPSQSIIDNPDQRIVDDLSSFTGTAIAFSLTLFNAAVDLISFSNILYGIYPPLFVVLLAYSIGGTAISVFLGKGLVDLNFLQEKKEADFRYGLVRIRENAESVAFYGGEESEMNLLLQRFKSAFENLTELLIASRNLEFFTNGYRYLIQVLPVAVIAPMYFSGKIEFGVINQSVSAFNHILSDFSLIVYQFQAISAFSAVINRLGEFDDILETSSSSKSLSDTPEKIYISYQKIGSSSVLDSNGSTPPEKYQTLLEIENMTLKTPSNAILVRDLSLTIKGKDNLLIMGPSGSGKTSLLRALAGLWDTGTGKITYYVNNEENMQQRISLDVNNATANKDHDAHEEHEKSLNRISGAFFLPQRPYMVLGSLRQQLLYPTWADDAITESENTKARTILPFLTKSPNSDYRNEKPEIPTTDELKKVLEDVRLGYLLARFSLDSTQEWSSVLSLGEQQRLAFARLLLSTPKLVLLDESTSALDEPNEAHLYQKISVAGVTYISIGHRQTLCEYHNRILRISPLDSNSDSVNWSVESTRDKSSDFTKLEL